MFCCVVDRVRFEDSRVRPIALLALLLLTAPLRPAPAAADATPRRAAIDRMPAVLHAGETVELAWQAPRGARELEILLYLSPESRTAFRVTAELDPALGRARWRVPVLPALAARLVLRWGDARGEFTGSASAPFRIVTDTHAASASRARGPGLVHEGAWAGGEPDGIPPRGLDDGARLGIDAAVPPAVETIVRCAAPARASQPALAMAAPTQPTRRAVRGAWSRAPEVIPQRN